MDREHLVQHVVMLAGKQLLHEVQDCDAGRRKNASRCRASYAQWYGIGLGFRV